MVDHSFTDPLLVSALSSGKGLDFQRLEFLGDSVMESSVLAGLIHAGNSGNEYAADKLVSLVRGRTSTEHLAGLGIVAQITDLLGFQPGKKRKADLVEATAGALFVDGGWEALDRFVEITGLIPQAPPVRQRGADLTLVPDGDQLAAALDDADDLSVAVALGMQTIECAVSWWAFRVLPRGNEGILTAVAQDKLSRRRLANTGTRLKLPSRLGRPENAFRAWVGHVALSQGRNSALMATSDALNLGLPPTAAARRAGS